MATPEERIGAALARVADARNAALFAVLQRVGTEGEVELPSIVYQRLTTEQYPHLDEPPLPGEAAFQVFCSSDNYLELAQIAADALAAVRADIHLTAATGFEDIPQPELDFYTRAFTVQFDE